MKQHQQKLVKLDGELEEFLVVLKKWRKLNSSKFKPSEAVKFPVKKKLEIYADVSSQIDIKKKFGLERKVLQPASKSTSKSGKARWIQVQYL